MRSDTFSEAVMDFVRTQGPLLSVAKSISDTRQLPKSGQRWRVEVYIVDCTGEPIRRPTWNEYSWEVNLTASLIQKASILARNNNFTRPLMGWSETKGDIVVHLKADFPTAEPLRTSEEEMREFSLDVKDTCRDWLSNASKLPLLDFCYRWDCHVPSDVSKDVYRGFCHGIRIALDVCFIFQSGFPDVMALCLLEELYRYLAGRAAECYFEGYSKRSDIRPSASFEPFFNGEEVPRPFRVSRPEIERLSRDATDEAIATLGPLQPDVPASIGHPPAAPSIEAGESLGFYEGLVHAAKLSQEIALSYEELTLPDPLIAHMSLAKGAYMLSCVAAKHWMQTSGSSTC